MHTSRDAPRLGGGDRGASVAEYSLLLVLLTVICIVGVTVLGLHTTGVLDKAGDGFERSPVTTVDCCNPPDGPPGTSGPSDPPTTTDPPPCPTDPSLPQGAPCPTGTTGSP